MKSCTVLRLLIGVNRKCLNIDLSNGVCLEANNYQQFREFIAPEGFNAIPARDPNARTVRPSMQRIADRSSI